MLYRRHDFVVIHRNIMAHLHMGHQILDMQALGWLFSHAQSITCCHVHHYYNIIKFPQVIVDPSYHVSDLPVNSISVKGGGALIFNLQELSPYILSGFSPHAFPAHDGTFSYNSHLNEDDTKASCANYDALIPCRVPIGVLVEKLSQHQILEVACVHNIHFSAKLHVDSLRQGLKKHNCLMCTSAVTLFKCRRLTAHSTDRNHKDRSKMPLSKYVRIVADKNAKRTSKIHHNEYIRHKLAKAQDFSFPPPPPSNKLIHQITRRFCEKTSSTSFFEVGCAICGQLTLYSNLSPISNHQLDLNILKEGVTRKEHQHESEPIQDVSGPIMDTTCDKICVSCRKILLKGKVPSNALANGLWLGIVPPELEDLQYAEKILIARVGHN